MCFIIKRLGFWGLRVREGMVIERGGVVAELNGVCVSAKDRTILKEIEKKEKQGQLWSYRLRKDMGYWMVLHGMAPSAGWFANATCDEEYANAEFSEMGWWDRDGEPTLSIVLLGVIKMVGGVVVWVFYAIEGVMCCCGLGKCSSRRLLENGGSGEGLGGIMVAWFRVLGGKEGGLMRWLERATPEDWVAAVAAVSEYVKACGGSRREGFTRGSTTEERRAARLYLRMEGMADWESLVRSIRKVRERILEGRKRYGIGEIEVVGEEELVKIEGHVRGLEERRREMEEGERTGFVGALLDVEMVKLALGVGEGTRGIAGLPEVVREGAELIRKGDKTEDVGMGDGEKARWRRVRMVLLADEGTAIPPDRVSGGSQLGLTKGQAEEGDALFLTCWKIVDWWRKGMLAQYGGAGFGKTELNR